MQAAMEHQLVPQWHLTSGQRQRENDRQPNDRHPAFASLAVAAIPQEFHRLNHAVSGPRSSQATEPVLSGLDSLTARRHATQIVTTYIARKTIRLGYEPHSYSTRSPSG